MPEPVVEVTGVTKDYRGLRPLRIRELIVQPGERVAITGFDRVSAEVFVNLITGATLPDAGRVVLFGRPSADITDSADWLSVVDRFGIVSERAVLLEPLTVVQNLAMPFTLAIEPVADDVRVQAEALAQEMRLPRERWEGAVSALDAAGVMRVRLGRALAHQPLVLLLEHVSAGWPAADAAAFARDVAAIAADRGLAVLALTADESFGKALGARTLTWQPATGRLAERGGWFSRRLG